MKVTLTVQFDPMEVNTKDISAALKGVGISTDALKMTVAREAATVKKPKKEVASR